MRLKDYIRGNRKGKQARRIELDAMQDPFLGEALEGFDSCEGDHAAVMERLSGRLAERTRKIAQARHVPLWRRPAILSSAAALAVCLLISGIIYRYSLSPDIRPQQYAVIEDEMAPITRELPSVMDTVAMEESAEINAMPEIVEITVQDVLNIVSDDAQIETRGEYVISFEDFCEEDVILPAASSIERPVEESAYVTGRASERIYGTVTDYAGQRLTGAFVVVKGTTAGTVTDINGQFALTASIGDVLNVSYLGYESIETVVRAPQMNIMLAEASSQLDEVVVTALGIKREERALSYNVQTENAKRTKREKFSKPSPLEVLSVGPASHNIYAGGRFISVESSPVSSFGLNVSGNSYAYIKEAVSESKIPESGRVKIEQMLNSSPFAYFTPQGKGPVNIVYEVGQCPWNMANKLVLITICAKEDVNDAKVEVHFDPTAVGSYKLIGYEDGGVQPVISEQTAGENLAAGSRVVAVYEIIPKGEPAELMNIKLSYKQLGQKREKSTEVSVFDSTATPSQNFYFYSTVSWFGKLLRESASKSEYELLISYGREKLLIEQRSEPLLNLIEQTKELVE